MKWLLLIILLICSGATAQIKLILRGMSWAYPIEERVGVLLYYQFDRAHDKDNLVIDYMMTKDPIVLQLHQTPSLFVEGQYDFGSMGVGLRLWHYSAKGRVHGQTPNLRPAVVVGQNMSADYWAVNIFGRANRGLRDIRHAREVAPIRWAGESEIKAMSLEGVLRLKPWFVGIRLIFPEYRLVLGEYHSAYVRTRWNGRRAIWDNSVSIFSHTHVDFWGFGPTLGVVFDKEILGLIIQPRLEISAISLRGKRIGGWRDIDDVTIHYTDRNYRKTGSRASVLYYGHSDFVREFHKTLPIIEGDIGVLLPASEIVDISFGWFYSYWIGLPAPPRVIFPEWHVFGTSEWIEPERNISFSALTVGFMVRL